jgi:hypothetical protein
MSRRARLVRTGLLVAAMTLIAGGPAWAQPAAGEVDLRPRWKAGDRQTISAVRARETVRGTQRSRSTTRVEIAIHVREAGPSGSLVEWTFGTPRVEDADPARAELTRELAALTSGTRYELEVDANGHITRLRNWEDLRAVGEAGVRRILDRLRATGAPEQVISAVSGMVGTMFSSEEQMRTHGLREASLYHAAYGRAYRRGVSVDYEVDLPSPLGNTPIPSRGSFRLLRVEAGAAVIDWQQRVDPNVAREVVRRTLTDMAARMGRPAPREDELPPVSVEDTGQLQVDTATGWLRSLTHRRMSRSGPAARIDELSMTEKR